MRQQARSRTAPVDRAGGQGRLCEALTRRAGHAWPHNPVHHKPARSVLQFFGDVLTDPLQRSAAMSAVFSGRQNRLMALQMIRQRPAARLVLVGFWRGWFGPLIQLKTCRNGDLLILKPELKLVQVFRH